MRVIRARAMGMCRGVRNALARVRRIDRPEDVTIFGDLVHNEVVLADLERRGFVQMSEEERRGAMPATEGVLVTAHGISDRELSRLLSAGKTVVDTTCPLVRHVKDAATAFHDEGRLVVVLGKPGHVEVEGIVGDLERYEVVDTPAAARDHGGARLGLVCQSTMRPEVANEIRARLRTLNPTADIRFADTICRPTRRRQEAIETLVAEVEAVVVVGGRHSNNTRQLARRVAARGLPVFHVASEAELDPAALAGFRTVGVTAGTSALPDTIDAVCARLAARGDQAGESPSRAPSSDSSPRASFTTCSSSER